MKRRARILRWSAAIALAVVVHGVIFLSMVDRRPTLREEAPTFVVTLEQPEHPPPPPVSSPSSSRPAPHRPPARAVPTDDGLPAAPPGVTASGTGSGAAQGGQGVGEGGNGEPPRPLLLGCAGQVLDLLSRDRRRECEEERYGRYAKGADSFGLPAAATEPKVPPNPRTEMMKPPAASCRTRSQVPGCAEDNAAGIGIFNSREGFLPGFRPKP